MKRLKQEIWKDIPGYEGQYQVSNLGNVISLRRYCRHTKGYVNHNAPKLRKPHINTSGYYHIRLLKEGLDKSVSVHILVARAFIPNPDGKIQINHIDSNRLNNRVDNLEWCTPRENLLHAYRSGNKKSAGKYNGNSKLNEQDAIQISSLDLPRRVLAEKFGVSLATIDRIKQGKGWKTVLV